MPKSVLKIRKKNKRARSMAESWVRKHDKMNNDGNFSLEEPEGQSFLGQETLDSVQTTAESVERSQKSPLLHETFDETEDHGVHSDWDADVFIKRNPKWNQRKFSNRHVHSNLPTPSQVVEPQFESISDESINAHKLEVEETPRDMDTSVIQGNRIVQLGYVLKRTIELQYEHSKKCTFGKLIVNEEQRRGRGMTSNIIFKCNMCQSIYSLETEHPRKQKSVINVGAVWGTLATGSSYEHLSELLSCMDVPPMNGNMFYALEEELGKEWESSLSKSMETAAIKEKNIAVEKNQICSDGIPWITIYVDGSWSKRSYGTNYNALSGMAAIIGKNTGEVLYIGVRNKFCSICSRAAAKNEEQKEHTCYKNWEGSAPAMEADILVEGFNESEAVYGLRYLKFVGDGDSSVFCKIQEKVTYGNQVKKVECTNHALKNYGKRLRKTKADTQISSEGRKLLTLKKINLLTKRAKCSIYEHSQSDARNVDLLRRDLRFGLHHVFGDHSECRPNICNTPQDTSNNQIPDLKRTLIYNHLAGNLDVLVRKTELLVENENNNRAERLMNIVARFSGGKRLNFIQRGSYQRRVCLSGLRHNKKFYWHCSPYKNVTGESPGTYFNHFMEQKSSVQGSRCKRKLFHDDNLMPQKKFKTKISEVNRDYGPLADQPEDEEVIQSEVEEVIKRLKVNEAERNSIQERSVGQFGNEVFNVERSKRLTASLFGQAIRRKAHTPCHNLVKSCLKKTFFWSEATEYGIAKEKVAIALFESETNLKVKESGLWVDLEYGFLGASPDGIIVSEDALVEVKCLFSASKLDLNTNTIAEVMVKLKGKICLEDKDGQIKLKRSHSYYYQIQGQLNIARKQKCYFIIYVNDKVPLYIETIIRDETFWNEKMLPGLICFYKTCIAPEIVRNNLEKGKKCVDPPHILEAIQRYEQKRSKNKEAQ